MGFCVCVGFVMCGCVYVWVFNAWVCVVVGFVLCGFLCMCGFSNAWVCVVVGFVMCGFV